jgi:branched-chain amino acid transport system permease protein
MVFGAAPRAGPSLVGTGSVAAMGLAFDRQSLAILVTAFALMAATHLILHRTQVGRQLRACAADPEMARAIGIPVARMTALSFAASAALAGVTGLLLSHQFYVTPVEGNALMLKAYIAVVLGGWGRVGGALAGAFIVAAFEAGLSAWLSHPVAEGALYIAVLLVLLLRPRGLFGEAAGRRV